MEKEGLLINEALRLGAQYTSRGKTASYIGELSKKDPSHLGLALCTLDGQIAAAGYSEEKFTMQSISKVVTLIAALEQNGQEKIFSRVGMEPTGDAFNSMVRLDLLEGSRPFNPMINAGAIAVADCIQGGTVDERIELCLDFARRLTNNPGLCIDRAVLASEKATGYKKPRHSQSAGIKRRGGRKTGGDTGAIFLHVLRQRRLPGPCVSRGCSGRRRQKPAYRGAAGKAPDCAAGAGSLMTTCGMYDYSGQFASTVGIPSKSGVGGGIISAAAGKCGIAVYGPALDEHGNSVGGLKMLEYLSEKMDLNMF
jgi:glutaminase